MIGRWSTSRFVLGLFAVVAVGVALRALPLWQSPLPFNPDGFYHVRNAGVAARRGRLPLDLVAVDDLGFGTLLALVQLLTGERIRYAAQPVIAVVGTLPAVIAAVLARRVAGRLGHGRSRAAAAGLVAGAVLAVGGVYLYRSTPVDEQTVGLSVVSIALCAATAYVWSGERRWLAVTLPTLAVLPPLHNLDSMVVGLSLLAGVALPLSARADASERLRRALGLAGGYWSFFAVYTVGVAAFTPATVIQNQRVSAAPGLLVAWVVLVVVTVGVFVRMRPRRQRATILVPFACLFGLVVVNAVVPVFPGTATTSSGVLVAASGLVVPVVLAAWGTPFVFRDAGVRAVMVALVAGPLTFLGFALSAALTPVYLETALRTHWFLYLPVAVLAGVAVTFSHRSVLGETPARRGALVVVLLAAVAVSIPTAFGGLAVHNYKGVTTTGEFAASSFAVEHAAGGWASDDHLVRITRSRQRGTTGSTPPVYDWIYGNTDPPDCPVLVHGDWTTVGAQFFPRAPETISHDRLEAVERSAHRVYDGGSAERLTLAVPSTDRREGC